MSIEEAFNNIYTESSWGESEGSLSGGGSSRYINKTRNLFLAFAALRLGIVEIHDICGDCNWQRDFMKLIPNVRYLGYDVSDVALSKARNQNRILSNMSISPNSIDLTKAQPNKFTDGKSLFLVKEVIQHLPLERGLSMIRNIKNAGFDYIAITHHDPDLFPKAVVNEDVEPGGFYPNNIFTEPFNFKNPVINVADFLHDKLKAGMGNLIVFDLQEQEI